jgi:hypothetical protein
MVVLAGIAAACLQPQLQPAYSQPSADSPLKAAAAVGESVSLSLGPLDALARRDPLALLELASARCSLEIGDYQCIMLKQEKLAGRLTPVQRIRMRYRATPHSVYLEWLENAGQAKRACYVTGRDMGQDGCELARIEPAGCIVQLFTREVTIPVNGQQARASSLQTMDKAGYAGTFRSLADVHHAAQRREVDRHLARLLGHAEAAAQVDRAHVREPRGQAAEQLPHLVPVADVEHAAARVGVQADDARADAAGELQRLRELEQRDAELRVHAGRAHVLVVTVAVARVDAQEYLAAGEQPKEVSHRLRPRALRCVAACHCS